jgi:amidase
MARQMAASEASAKSGTDELAFAGAARQAEMVRAGDVSPRELVELYLERIARLDPELNAFRTVMAERALMEADQAEARLRGGEDRPLLGVPVAVKDGQDVAGELSTYGTDCFDEPAREDSEVVRRLRAAGAIVIGKTHLPELAIYGFTESATWGVTRNPWNPHRSTGGSSGGSGAAVAAGMVPLATASDGAGSIRIPAANCGLFGLKPQRGRISLMPYSQHWFGMSVIGCLSRSVADTAVYLDAVAGPAAGDAHTPPPPDRPFAEAARSEPGKLRIAWSTKQTRPPIPGPTSEEIERSVAETAELLRSLGHEVVERAADYGSVGNMILPLYLGGIYEDVSNVPHPERLERRTRAIGRLGKLVRGLVPKALEAEAGHAARINAIFDDCDVYLTAVTAQPPVEVGRWEGRSGLGVMTSMPRVYPYTPAWNVIGNPAASVPAGPSSEGLPLAVQIVGRPNDEATLLSLATQLEAERPWADRRPPIS